jgi:hypothetical protein
MQSRDPESFWSNFYKISYNKVTEYAIAVGNAVGENGIVDIWKDYYKQLL